jgi:hypothetical protein
MTSAWAPCVYGQTLHADFRELVRPAGFPAATHALELARLSVTQPDLLPGRPRWFAARAGEWCMAGVGCMAREVAGGHPTRDSHGRECYVTLAGVCLDPTAPLPDPDDRLELVRRLYRYVRDRWDEPAYEKDRVVVTSEVLDWPAGGDTAQPLPLNTDDLCVFCHLVEDGRRLWAAASRHRGPITVYLNMPSVGEARHPLCLNATVIGLTEALEVRRERQEPGPPGATTVMTDHDRQAAGSSPEPVEIPAVALEPRGKRKAKRRKPEPLAAPDTNARAAESEPPEPVWGLGSLVRSVTRAARATGHVLVGFLDGLTDRTQKDPAVPTTGSRVEPEPAAGSAAPPPADEPPPSDRSRTGGPLLDPRWGFHPVEKPPDSTDSGPPTEGPARDRR